MHTWWWMCDNERVSFTTEIESYWLFPTRPSLLGFGISCRGGRERERGGDGWEKEEGGVG